MRRCSCDWTNEEDRGVAIERLDDGGADMTPEETAPVRRPVGGRSKA